MIFNLAMETRSPQRSLCSRYWRGLVLLTTFLLLSACSTRPSHSVIDFANVSEVSHWNARGKLLLRNNKDKLSGYFFWQQKGKRDFKLVITSFIGTSLMTLDFVQGQTTLHFDGKTYQGANPEQLIYQLTGSRLPVNSMANWMLGQAPELANISYQSKTTTGNQPQIEKFSFKDHSQNHWQVAYQQYQTIGLLTLPEKMTINGLNNRIKLTINDWELLAP